MGNESSRKLTAQCAGCKKDIHPQSSKYRKCSFLNCLVVCCKDCKNDYMFKHGKSKWFCSDHHFHLLENSGEQSRSIPKQPPSARAPAMKRDQPPTPAMTPGTQAIFRPNDSNSSIKRFDNVQTPLGENPNGHGEIPYSYDVNNPHAMYAPPGSQPYHPLQQPDAGFYGSVSEPSVTDETQSGTRKPKRTAAAKKAADVLARAREDASPKTAAAAADAARSAAELYSQSLGQYSIGTGSINSIELLNKMLETKGDAGLMIHGDLDTNQDGNSVRPRYWSPEEDEKLRLAVEQYGPKHWKTIATFVPGRTHVQCLQRWNKVLKPGLRKGAWTEEEDDTLQNLVNDMHPDVNWSTVSDHIPGRTAKQCRERWSFNLDPNINKGDWTDEEDETLLKAQLEVGNKWSHIAAMLPGRTENAIKTRFKSILRAKKREWRPSEDALLLKYHEELGNKWEEIAAHLPNRTKNAVKTRFKFLTEDKPVKIPVKPTPKPEDKKRSTFIRTGASQSTKAAAMSAEARARARVAAAAALTAADAIAASAASSVPQSSSQDSVYSQDHEEIMPPPMPGRPVVSDQRHVNQQQQQQHQLQQPEQQQPMGMSMHIHQGGYVPTGPNFAPNAYNPVAAMQSLGTPLGAQQGSSLSSINSLNVNSLTRSQQSNKDSKVMLHEMLEDLANMEFEQGYDESANSLAQAQVVQSNDGYYIPDPNGSGMMMPSPAFQPLRNQGNNPHMQQPGHHLMYSNPPPVHHHPGHVQPGHDRQNNSLMAGNSYNSAFDDLNLDEIMDNSSGMKRRQ